MNVCKGEGVVDVFVFGVMGRDQRRLGMELPCMYCMSSEALGDIL